MTALSQFALKNITNRTMYVGINFAAFKLHRSLVVSLLKYEETTKYQLTCGKLRNIHTYGIFFSNTFDLSTSENNSDMLSDDEDELSIDSLERPDKYSFRAECSKQEQLLVTQLQLKGSKTEEITNEEWDLVRSSVLQMFGTLNERNIDAVIMNKCAVLKSLSLGKSYFKYLKTTNKSINRAVYGNYLRLFYECRDCCNGDDLNEIVILYKELMEVYPMLDSHTAEKAVCALSLTKEWKEYEKLFVKIRQFYHPSVYVYKIVIMTAFDKGEFELGWKLMEEIQYQGSQVPEEVFLYWLEKVKCRRSEEDFLKVLNFLYQFNIKPSDEFCKGIKKAFEDYTNGKVSFTRVSRNGECRCCHFQLEPCNVSQEDFNELKKEFLNPILVGNDIFCKTKPDEFEEFLKFLDDHAPFDVVLDGLNIALGGKNKSISAVSLRLRAVVHHFVSLKKKVLVLGRKHMKSWRTPNMDYVFRNALVFLTDNLSQDDPFMLYSAIHSGLGTIFVSQDMMRGHKFLLSDDKLRTTFHKWQSKHQYFISYIGNDGRVYFKEPVSFMQTIQRNSQGDWHIPYVVRGEELPNTLKMDHLHRHWMCLQRLPARGENPEYLRPYRHPPRGETVDHRPSRSPQRMESTAYQRPDRSAPRMENSEDHRPGGKMQSFRPEKERHWRNNNDKPFKKLTSKINIKNILKDDDVR